jgi:hypothetical protein
MSDQATPAPEAPVQPNIAIENLRGALDSIARNDLNTETTLTERPPNPSATIPSHAINNEGELKAESTPEVAERKVESVTEAEEVQPEGDSAKVRWKELKQAEKELKIAQKELTELKK